MEANSYHGIRTKWWVFWLVGWRNMCKIRPRTIYLTDWPH